VEKKSDKEQGKKSRLFPICHGLLTFGKEGETCISARNPESGTRGKDIPSFTIGEEEDDNRTEVRNYGGVHVPLRSKLDEKKPARRDPAKTPRRWFTWEEEGGGERGNEK